MAPPFQSIINPNILEHPQLHGPIAAFGRNPQWSTIGDLHGNVMQFFYFAAHRGAIKISPEDYAAIATLYNNWTGTPEEKAAYRQLLTRIEVAPNAKLRLIGDELFDRGASDDMSLDAFVDFKNKQRSAGGAGELEVILSNHSFGFIHAIEHAIALATHDNILDLEVFKNYILNIPLKMKWPFSASFQNLQYALTTGTTTAQEILDRYNSYKSNFKAFSYDYDSEGKVVIYSHAPIAKKTIITVAKSMENFFEQHEISILSDLSTKTPLQDHDLLPLIDAINRVVSLKANENKLIDILYNGQDQSGFLINSALTDAFENREDPGDDDINNTHGHTSSVFGNRTTLDGLCGRTDLIDPERIAHYAKLHNRSVVHYKSLNYTASYSGQVSAQPPAERTLNRIEYVACTWDINVAPNPPKNLLESLQLLSLPAYMSTDFSIGLQSQNSSSSSAENSTIGVQQEPLLRSFDDKWNDSWGTYYGYAQEKDFPNGVAIFRSTVFGGLLPFVNGLIDLFTGEWVKNKFVRVLIFPLSLLRGAVKFPLMLLSGALGTGMGIVAAIFSRPTEGRRWTPILAGLSDGLWPFAPNAANWIKGKLLQQHDLYETARQDTKNVIVELTREAWSWTYIASLTISSLFVASIIIASDITGGGAGLGMIKPLSSAFGAVRPYLAGSMFVGGLTTFLSGVASGIKYIFRPAPRTGMRESLILPQGVVPQPSAGLRMSANLATNTAPNPMPGTTSQREVLSLRLPLSVPHSSSNIIKINVTH